MSKTSNSGPDSESNSSNGKHSKKSHSGSGRSSGRKSSSGKGSSSGDKNGADKASGNNTDEAVLLAKLDEANRLLEADQKSAKSLSVNGSAGPSGHSRKGSISSQNSATSVNSHVSNLNFDYDPAHESLHTVLSKHGIQAPPTKGGAPEDSWILWGKIIDDWEGYSKKKAYLKDLVRKGIPHHFRGLVWQMLASQYNNVQMKDLYLDYLKQNSPYEKVIRRDISRTYPDHDFFRDKDGLGQESLFNVMKAYSLHDREVGYCQGSGFIVGLLLMQMPEEEAFCVYVALMFEYKLRDLFKPNMYELGMCMFKLECMLQEFLPDVYMHFESTGFYTSIYASSWFLTLYTTTLPLSLCCRIMDIFLSEGFDIIYRVAVAILCCSQVELMNGDMEGMIKHLQRVVPAKYEADPDSLLQTAFQVKVNMKKLKKLEKDYLAAKTREHEDQIELRRLRSENRLLRQRVENLERETRHLADRIIEDKVHRAQEAELMLSIKRELSAVKQHDSILNDKYQDALNRINEYKEKMPRKSSTCSGANCSESSELVRELQTELMSVRLKEADSHCKLKEMKNIIQTLENENDKLQREPSMTIESLREELIAIKVREAESDLYTIELKGIVQELEQQFQVYVEKNAEKPSGGVTALLKNRSADKHSQEEIMSLRLNVAKRTIDIRETRQKVMELETQNQIHCRQINRLEKDNDHLKEKVEESLNREKDLLHETKDHERKLNVIESDRKEETMMWRIRDAENSQKTAEMRQRIAELEIENQECLTAGQLRGTSTRGDNELENKIAELQEELIQHRMNSSMNMSFSGTKFPSDSDSDSEEELNRTIRENQMTASGLMGDLGLCKSKPDLMTMSMDLRFLELTNLVNDVKTAQHEAMPTDLDQILNMEGFCTTTTGFGSITPTGLTSVTPTQDTGVFSVNSSSSSCVNNTSKDSIEESVKTSSSSVKCGVVDGITNTTSVCTTDSVALPDDQARLEALFRNLPSAPARTFPTTNDTEQQEFRLDDVTAGGGDVSGKGSIDIQAAL